MTDDVGMLQHAIASVPNYSEGYTTDDNARALLLTVSLEELGDPWTARTGGLANRYLAFLWHAYNLQNGRFRNFMAYDRRWLEEMGSPDSHARALWALGAVLGRSRQQGLRRRRQADCSRWPCRPPAISPTCGRRPLPLRLARLSAAFFRRPSGPGDAGLAGRTSRCGLAAQRQNRSGRGSRSN